MSRYIQSHFVLYTNSHGNLVIIHVTVCLFSCHCIQIQCVVYLTIWLYDEFSCHLLIRFISLIYFTSTYNSVHGFLIYFFVCRFMLLTKSYCLLIHVTCGDSWNVFHRRKNLIASRIFQLGFKCENHLERL